MTNVPAHRPIKLRVPIPAFSRTAAELQGYVASLGAERVAEVLRVAVVDLEPLLASRVVPTAGALRRLRKLT